MARSGCVSAVSVRPVEGLGETVSHDGRDLVHQFAEFSTSALKSALIWGMKGPFGIHERLT